MKTTLTFGNGRKVEMDLPDPAPSAQTKRMLEIIDERDELKKKSSKLEKLIHESVPFMEMVEETSRNGTGIAILNAEICKDWLGKVREAGIR